MKNGEKPAFPASQSTHNKDEMGMTKREYFAAMAMQGLLYHSIMPMSPEAYAKKAIELSDELLKQLGE